MSVVWIQFYVLLGGTAFAWYNFISEFIAWTKGKKCKTGCPVNVKNPFLTPCFGGAIFFTIAFILNLLLLQVSY
jgi:hypothetical protein